MNILVLCEGNADSWNCWSGTAKSIVDELRAQGHHVTTGDVDLYGADRWTAAALTATFDRRRWATRYHLGDLPFRLRSRKAQRHIAACRGSVDVILQIGATFEPLGRGSVPYCLCCDSNIRVSQQGASTGCSDAAAISDAEVETIARREQRVYRESAAVFTLSNRLRRSMIDEFEVPPGRAHAVYAGPNLDLAGLPTTKAPRAAGHPPTVLFVGLQFQRKGGDLLVQAFSRVKTQLPAARLIVVGERVEMADAPGITFLGRFDKNDPDGWAALLAAYTSADVFALPTRFEPFGVAFVEAMHFALPCIGPDAWAVPEIIENGRTGFTVAADDVDDLAKKLFRLLSDRELAHTMGQAGRERARRLFTWPRVVGRMTQVMTDVVQRNRQPIGASA